MTSCWDKVKSRLTLICNILKIVEIAAVITFAVYESSKQQIPFDWFPLESKILLAVSVFLGIIYKMLDDVQDSDEKPDKVKIKVKFYVHIIARICMFVVYLLSIIRLQDKTLVSMMGLIQTISGMLIILRTKEGEVMKEYEVEIKSRNAHLLLVKVVKHYYKIWTEEKEETSLPEKIRRSLKVFELTVPTAYLTYQRLNSVGNNSPQKDNPELFLGLLTVIVSSELMDMVLKKAIESKKAQGVDMEKLKKFIVGKFMAEFAKRVGIVSTYAVLLGLDENKNDVHWAIIIISGIMTMVSLICRGIQTYKKVNGKGNEKEKQNKNQQEESNTKTLLTSAQQ